VIRLDADHSISRRHAEVYERSGAVYIRDLDSTHGTQVNGIWIADQRLEPGDEVQVGGSTLVFKVQDGIS
jgi:pSer/pThr/pTyr-binding forkhead associated (FHA) protein